MTLALSVDMLADIHAHGEQAYPEEGAGLLLGSVEGERRRVLEVVKLANRGEAAERGRRYRLAPQDYLRGEELAAQRGLQVLGIFHSHPDHPERPSEFDRQWAWPFFSYLITSVEEGRAITSRAWVLREDRSAFLEEPLEVSAGPQNDPREAG